MAKPKLTDFAPEKGPDTTLDTRRYVAVSQDTHERLKGVAAYLGTTIGKSVTVLLDFTDAVDPPE